METREEKQDDVTIVAVQGQLDTVSAVPFEARLLQLIDAGERRILVNCAGLDYVNSAGLKAFLVAARRLDAEGGKLVLCALVPGVYAVFEMIGFTRVMCIVPTREEALSILAGEPAVA